MENLDRKYYSYLSGKMPTDEREAFEQTIANDPAMQAELKEHKMAMAIGKRVEHNETKQWVRDIMAREDKLKSQPRFWRRPLMMAASFIGILILGATFLYVNLTNNPSPQKLMAEYYTPPPYSGTKSATDNSDNLNLAQVAFSAKNYNQVILLINKLPDTIQSTHFVKELLGHAYLNAEQPNLAIPIFRNLTQQKTPEYLSDNLWNLSLSFLANEQLDSTSYYLNQLVQIETPSNLKVKAKELISDLE